MDDKKKFSMPPRYVLFFLMVICCALLAVSYIFPSALSPVTNAVNSVLLPMEKGFNYIGTKLADAVYDSQSLSEARAENSELKTQIAELEELLTNYEQELAELEELQELFELSEQYSEYEMTAARIIQKDSGNWYHSFVIDKGSDDGIEVDMNVIADGGLVGIVTDVGSNYARVQSIIDDDSNVSAMSLSTGATCIVSGSLELYSEGLLAVSYIDKDDTIEDGDKIVTSTISSKYLPNILIGYAQDIEIDSNNLTKSGYIIPAVDFDDLNIVLVITTTKVTGEEESG